MGLSLTACSGGMTTSGGMSICTGGAFRSVDSAEVGLMICGCELLGATCAAELELDIVLGSGDCMSVVSRWSYVVACVGPVFGMSGEGGGRFVGKCRVYMPFDAVVLSSAACV